MFKKGDQYWKLRKHRGNVPAEIQEEDKKLKKFLVLEYKKHKKEITRALIEQAERGNVPAIKEIHERAMGRVTEKTELTGRNGAPVSVISFRDFKNFKDSHPEVKTSYPEINTK